MDRRACVDLRALPLQLLLRDRPEWAAHPTAVVAEDRPQGLILWVNERARRRRILPGARYAEGLALAADLRARVVPESAVAEAVQAVTALLRRFSPGVEPSDEEPGLSWLDASGLERLHPSLEAWARGITLALRAELRLRAAVAVGFSRFGSYAVARSTALDRVRLCEAAAEEQRLARAVPLQRLALPPRLREALHRLGVQTVGDLVRLPASGLLERFGPEAHALHALATGQDPAPLLPAPEIPPVQERIDLDQPEPETTRLLFLIKGRLHRLLAELARRGQALGALRLDLELDLGWYPGVDPADARQAHALRPAEPTLDCAQLSDLVRLRLEAVAARGRLGRGVDAVELIAEGVTATREQLRLFAQKPRRDLEATNRALARLRAELGEQAVVRAVLQDRHLPEERFTLEPLERLARPRPREGERVLVRRLLPSSYIPARSPALQARLPGERAGPFILSGGWWRGDEVHRAYGYARTSRGDLLWIYRDGQRWLLQGRVE